MHNFDGITPTIANIRPTSRGEVNILSNDSRENPKIKMNYLSTQDDRDVAAKSLKIVRKIMLETKAFKKYEPKEAFIGDNKEGLKFYKEIIKKFRNNIKLNGYLAFEIGDNQFMQINKLLISNGFIVISKYKLINNQIRCLLAKKVKNYTLQ